LARGWRRRKKANIGWAFVLMSSRDDVMGFEVYVIRGWK
jgi:hypothetical protein